jgi:hypothetical protein
MQQTGMQAETAAVDAHLGGGRDLDIDPIRLPLKIVQRTAAFARFARI